MKEVGSFILLFENLELTPIQSILWADLHTHKAPARAGATGYEALFSELNVILEVNRFKGKPERINHYLKVKLHYHYKVNSLNALSFVLK